MVWMTRVILGLAAAVVGFAGCEQQVEPATDRTIVGTWELDTGEMTDEALQRVELRMREAARNARPARPAAPAEGENRAEGNNAEGEGAARPTQPAAANNDTAGPSPAEINAAKEKERTRLAGMATSLTIRPDGSYLAEYTTKDGDKETRRVVIGEWTLAAGILLLKETEIVLHSEGDTGLEVHRFEAERSRLAAVTMRGTPPPDVQEILRRR